MLIVFTTLYKCCFNYFLLDGKYCINSGVVRLASNYQIPVGDLVLSDVERLNTPLWCIYCGCQTPRIRKGVLKTPNF